MAVLHLDGDAFFASVEAAKDPSLRGKPIVTGRERGIASAMSYEAKALGIHRAMPVFKIRKEFPQVAIVSSDYDAYAAYSHRMMNIVRRHAPDVEGYSIDECFASVPDRYLHEGGEGFLRQIQADIRRELGIGASLGLATTKVLAKVASKTRKPMGATVIAPEDRERFLSDMPIGKIWGIGPSATMALGNKGVRTALDFARKDRAWVERECGKSLRDIWCELCGVPVMAVGDGREMPQSIRRTRSFSPKSRDKELLYSELSHNAEMACARAREHGLLARSASMFIKRADFTYQNAEIPLALPTSVPTSILPEVRKALDRLFEPGVDYRATGVALLGFVPAGQTESDLFGATAAESRKERAWKAVDEISERLGGGLVYLASSARSVEREAREGSDAHPARPLSAKPLTVPFLGEAS